ncbi:hypothetical protein [Cupriavidus necator]
MRYLFRGSEASERSVAAPISCAVRLIERMEPGVIAAIDLHQFAPDMLFDAGFRVSGKLRPPKMHQPRNRRECI